LLLFWRTCPDLSGSKKKNNQQSVTAGKMQLLTNTL